jgi:hypothetical protein
VCDALFILAVLLTAGIIGSRKSKSTGRQAAETPPALFTGIVFPSSPP